MKKLLLLFGIGITFNFSAQELGRYEFTGTGACPNQNPNVTTQPANTIFDAFSSNNVFCVSANNVYNADGWNTTADIDLTEYFQFGMEATNCFRVTLDSIIFSFRNSPSGNTPTWHLRSSIDGYANDIASGLSNTAGGTTMFGDTIQLNPANFSSLIDVRFRIYLTNMGANGAAFRVDDVIIYGSEALGGPIDFYADTDGDGYGAGTPVSACNNPGGHVLNNLDCNDNDAAINPMTIWYVDADGDGFGDPNNSEMACSPSNQSSVLNADDCDDTNGAIHPNSVWYTDADGDGFGDDNSSETGCTSTLTNATLINGDCNDTDATINPSTIWYADLDGDGYGDPNTNETACSPSSQSYVMNADDCNDNDGAINPTTVWYADVDNDGFGDDNSSETGCTPTLANAKRIAGDCNDNDDTVNPNQIEDVCNNDFIDNNCDGQIDENYDEFLCNGGGEHDYYYADRDNDGYIDPLDEMYVPSDPGPPYLIQGSEEGEDCNDNDASINPGATEIPNDGIDQDCDGSDLIVSIDELYSNAIKLSPNPGKNELTVSIIDINTLTNVTLFDISGKVVLSSKLNTNSQTIDVSSIDKGTYQVLIQNDKFNVRKSWIKL